jgi:spermidine/putrescine-binding protein
MNKIKLKPTRLLLPILLIEVFIPIASSCASNNGIILANFEGYMSPKLMNRIRRGSSTPISYVYYGTNEDIDMKFERYYDLAIPSSYEVINLLMQNELSEID